MFTYKRNQLLTRAIESLRNQTFTDWVCEIHNDLPGNTFPAQYVNNFNDERFTVVNHPVNLGPTQSFNIAFSGCIEKYVSILEDDNWWEPSFLEEMTALMDDQPLVDVAWANMYIWKELPGNKWENTGQTIWNDTIDKTFNWPHPRQVLGALHSNGAMICRSINVSQYLIPNTVLFSAVELVRERSFKHPLYLRGKPLANFSQTIVTNRLSDRIKWDGTLIMMLSSYVANADNQVEAFSNALAYYRQKSPSPVPIFFISILTYLKNWKLLYVLTWRDWLKVFRWLIRNAFNIKSLKKYLVEQRSTWELLKLKTPKVPSSTH